MPLIPEMKLMDFQNLCENEVKDLPCTILTDVDGNYLATLIVPQTDFIKMQVEYLGQLSNGVKPKTDI